MTKSFNLPILVLFKDRTFDACGASIVRVPALWVRKGRTLTITNVDGSANSFEVSCPMILFRVKGTVRIAKPYKEVQIGK